MEQLPEQQKDALQIQLDSCMAELEQVEIEIDSQLQALSQSVDEGFGQLAQLGRAVMAGASGKGLAIGAGILAVANVVGRVLEAKKHNEALDKLLVVKQEIAAEKLARTQGIMQIAGNVIKRLEALLNNEAFNEYDIQQMNGNVLNAKFSAMERTMTIYRKAAYSYALVNYLCAEYKAWSKGRQCSDNDRPTLIDVNCEIQQHILSRCAVSDNVYIRTLFAYGNKPVAGCYLYSSTDPQLLATSLILYGLTQEEKIKSLPKLSSPLLSAYIKENPPYQIYRKYSRILNYFVKWCNAFVMTTLILVLYLLVVIGLFSWLDWNIWVERILGTILYVGPVLWFFARGIPSMLNNLYHSWKYNLYYKCLDKLRTIGGYVEIYRPDLEKKSLWKEGAKGALEGVLSIFG